MVEIKRHGGVAPQERKPPRLPPGLSCYQAFLPHPQHPERPFGSVAEAIKGNGKLQKYAEKSQDLYRKIEAAAPGADRQKAEDNYKSFKKNNLTAVTPSGTFSPQRRAEMLTRHSGLIVIDFDDVEDVEQCKRALAALPCVALVFISPSGKGLKPFIVVDPIPDNDAEHKVAFKAVERFLQDQGLPAKLTKEGGNRGQWADRRNAPLLHCWGFRSLFPMARPPACHVGSVGPPATSRSIPSRQRSRRHVMGSCSSGCHRPVEPSLRRLGDCGNGPTRCTEQRRAVGGIRTLAILEPKRPAAQAERLQKKMGEFYARQRESPWELSRHMARSCGWEPLPAADIRVRACVPATGNER